MVTRLRRLAAYAWQRATLHESAGWALVAAVFDMARGGGYCQAHYVKEIDYADGFSEGDAA